MPIVLRDLERKLPKSPKGRVRNYLVRRGLGATNCTLHENIINPGGIVPWHSHAIEEILIILEGRAECTTRSGSVVYEPGAVVIMPAGEEHTIENIGDVPMRQLCFFPTADAETVWRETEAYEGHELQLANANQGNTGTPHRGGGSPQLG